MVRADPKRVVFAEGEEPCVVRAAAAFQQAGLGKRFWWAARTSSKAAIWSAGLESAELEIRVPHSAAEATPYIDALYKRLQRRGALYRDCVRMVTNDRNIYAASLLEAGEADALVTGVTRAYSAALSDVRQVLDSPAGQRPMGVLLMFAKGKVIFAADTSVHEHPTSEQLADIAVQAARVARRLLAIRRGQPCSPLNPSAIPGANAPSALSRPSISWTVVRSILNMMARCRSMWRSTPTS